MNEKTNTNPKGSGIKKSEGRLKLEKSDLIQLMTKHEMKDIAVMFGISPTIVHIVLTNQLVERSIGFEDIIDEFEAITYYKSKGAWMDSKEKQSLINYKTLEK